MNLSTNQLKKKANVCLMMVMLTCSQTSHLIQANQVNGVNQSMIAQTKGQLEPAATLIG